MKKHKLSPEEAESLIKQLEINKDNCWHSDRDFALAFSRIFNVDGFRVIWDSFQDRIQKTLIIIDGQEFDESGRFNGDIVDYSLDGLVPSDFSENCQNYEDMYEIRKDDVFEVEREFLEECNPDPSRKSIREWIERTEKEIKNVIRN